MNADLQLPSSWAIEAARVAATIPEILTVHFFGSRVSGWSRHNRPWSPASDLDIALTFDGRNEGEREGNAIFLTPRFERALAAALDYTVKLQVQPMSDDDEIVGPAVKEHGRLIYDRSAEPS
jgi:predicted nucleotidyltransferase